tara:strand:+ start:1175 stop:1699 length:525 start_codon:yes stop_codon:yes gene_type:complete
MAKSSHMYANAYGDETIYIDSSADYDYSGESWRGGDKTILVNVAMASGKYIRLPEATASNKGLHIRIIYGLAPSAATYVGFVTSKIVGGAHTVGAATEGNAPTDAAMVSSAVGTSNLRVELDVDAAAKAGGHPGTILDFWYTGESNVVFYVGSLHADVDDATLATHFSTTAVNA